MDEPNEKRDRLAGAVYMQAQLASWLAVLAALACAAKSSQESSFATASGLFMVAATLGFGLLANAVLRR